MKLQRNTVLALIGGALASASFAQTLLRGSIVCSALTKEGSCRVAPAQADAKTDALNRFASAMSFAAPVEYVESLPESDRVIKDPQTGVVLATIDSGRILLTPAGYKKVSDKYDRNTHCDAKKCSVSPGFANEIQKVGLCMANEAKKPGASTDTSTHTD